LLAADCVAPVGYRTPRASTTCQTDCGRNPVCARSGTGLDGFPGVMATSHRGLSPTGDA